MAGGGAVPCRFCTVLLIVAKLGLVIAIIVFTAQLKNMVLEGLDKFSLAFDEAGMENEKRKCEDFSKVRNYELSLFHVLTSVTHRLWRTAPARAVDEARWLNTVEHTLSVSVDRCGL